MAEKIKENQFDEVGVNPFNAPIPGESLTASPETPRAWERPPEYTDQDEAMMAVCMVLTEQDTLRQLVGIISEGVPLDEIAQVLLYKGYTIQPYSPKAGTGLSSHELNQPGTYQDVSDTTVTAQFKTQEDSLPDFLKGKTPLYLLAWTTTPWTLPSNTALTVGPKIDYV